MIFRKTQKKEDNRADIHKIVDEAMARKDRYVSIYFGSQGTSVTVYPVSTEEDDVRTAASALTQQDIDFLTDACRRGAKYMIRRSDGKIELSDQRPVYLDGVWFTGHNRNHRDLSVCGFMRPDDEHPWDAEMLLWEHAKITKKEGERK